MKFRRSISMLAASFLAVAGVTFARRQASANSAPGKESVLTAAEVGMKLLPEKVFFRGQVATVQDRNTGGVRYADGFLVLAGLVDSSGYSTGLKEKYQGYLINEVPVEIGGKTLKPGAYGIGFLEGNKFVVMDIGASDVLQALIERYGDEASSAAAVYVELGGCELPPVPRPRVCGISPCKMTSPMQRRPFETGELCDHEGLSCYLGLQPEQTLRSPLDPGLFEGRTRNH